MRRRRRSAPATLLAASVLVGVLLAAAAPSASGWANGGDNGYGTHDWIVDQAVKVLDGRADWFDASIARLASDDPDTVEPKVTGSHVYFGEGRRGGAVDRIAREFDLASAAYAGGHMDDASYHLGLLSHFLGDVGQPFHTAYAGKDRDKAHLAYEHLVDHGIDGRNDRPAWSSGRRTVSTISDVRRTAVGVAAYSRSQWPAFWKSFSNDTSRLSSTVSDITGRLMRRVANDLADIIWSVSQGAGAQPAIGRLTVKVKWPGVAKRAMEAVFVKALDPNGRPIEGLEVVVDWPTDSGTRTEVLYTGPDGTQKRVGKAGTTPTRKRLGVTARATVRGATSTARSWWAITPALGSMRTKVSDRTVRVGQTVTVKTVARDRKGRGVPNLIVTWTWHLGSKKVKTTGITDANGKARSSRLITSSTTRKRVTVSALTMSGSHHRSSSTSFKRVD